MHEEQTQVYILALSDDGSPRMGHRFHCLPPPLSPYTLQFTLSFGNRACWKSILHCNYPAKGCEFVREGYHAHPFKLDAFGNALCEISISSPGTFQYYVRFHDVFSGDPISSSFGYFVVEPIIRLSQPRINTERILPIEAISIQTMIPKWMGPLEDWDVHFKNAALLKYNAIHLSPIQKRGLSNSAYSIANQLEISDDLFDPERHLLEAEKVQMVEQKFRQFREKYGLLFVSDVVWNHTAHSSSWLREHPEAGYNLVNSPHLTSAFDLDEAIIAFSENIEQFNLPRRLECESDLEKVMVAFKNKLVEDVRLWEYYVIDTDAAMVRFDRADKFNERALSPTSADTLEEILPLLQPEGVGLGPANGRYEKALKIDESITFVRGLCEMEGIPLSRLRERYRRFLDEVNLFFYQEYDEDFSAIISNMKNHVRYQRLEQKDIYSPDISAENPLVVPYFTRLTEIKSDSRYPVGSYCLANNGWIWASDPLQDFAAPGCRAYLRRDVIVWGDCVKLRYGTQPSDNPWLWDYMRQYSEMTARIFGGFRIDNCHSTPRHVAAYLLDCARALNPNLFVMAELFTGNADADEVFVRELGIHALIREAMQCPDPYELSRLVYRHGGRPIGSLWSATQGDDSQLQLKPSLPHALFFDATHDNPSPEQKRTAEDALSSAAIVAMTCSAIGSNRGYDECYPSLLDVVHETRRYALLQDPLCIGIGEARMRLNQLHERLAIGGYIEKYVHHENGYIVIHRQHPKTRQGILLIASTAFRCDDTERSCSTATFVFGYALSVERENSIPHGDHVLRGIPCKLVPFTGFSIEEYTSEGLESTKIHVNHGMPPGSILVFETSLVTEVDLPRAKVLTEVEQLVEKLNWLDLNAILYKCGVEEGDSIGYEHGTYVIPSHGALPFAGFAGIASVLEDVASRDDLGHMFCEHLRRGTWLFDYFPDRILRYSQKYPNLKEFGEYLKAMMRTAHQVPTYLRPLWCVQLMRLLDTTIKAAVVRQSLLSQNVPAFQVALLLTSVQFFGEVSSTSLHPTRPGPSLAAGLPHFAAQHMRSWGRDVFISLPGLFLTIGRFEEAKSILIAFASCIRHGLIPNLLDSGRMPRYNARDASWWFLRALRLYAKSAPEGNRILDEKVMLRFPTDDYIHWEDDGAYSKTVTMTDIVLEILCRHASGISFREWNAGPNLDHAMTEKGFNVDAAIDFNTGFVFGGNRWNCGTWMDKMGESDKAGNRGVPSTPRDGSAIELVALLKSTVDWMHELASMNVLKTTGVSTPDGQFVTWKEWSTRIQGSFERLFWNQHVGFYRDVLGSTVNEADEQIRPNVVLAMSITPEMFDKHHAGISLKLIHGRLMGPLGLKTLDPLNEAYEGFYDNGNDSDNPRVAKGANYHQGPEWLWLVGHYLQARWFFKHDEKQELQICRQLLRSHAEHISNSPWQGLPELTNKNGAECRDSCPTQAWSSATILEFLANVERQ